MVATSSRSRSRHQRSRDLEVDNSTNMHAWPNSNAASNRPPHSHRNGGRRTGTGSSISSGGSPRDHDALSDTVSHHSVSSAGVNWPVQRQTIHILRKHFYSSKFNLTSKLFTQTGFFFRQIKRISFSTLHFDKIFMLQFEIISTHRKMLKKIVKMLRLIKRML